MIGDVIAVTENLTDLYCSQPHLLYGRVSSISIRRCIWFTFVILTQLLRIGLVVRVPIIILVIVILNILDPAIRHNLGLARFGESICLLSAICVVDAATIDG